MTLCIFLILGLKQGCIPNTSLLGAPEVLRLMQLMPRLPIFDIEIVVIYQFAFGKYSYDIKLFRKMHIILKYKISFIV